MHADTHQTAEIRTAQAPPDLLRLGTPENLRRFYEAHVDGLYRYAYYRVGKDRHLAEEVVQETFLAAMRRPEDYDPVRGEPLAWLCNLSRNCIRAALKKHREKQTLIQQWDRIDARLAQTADASATSPLPEAALQATETRELVGVTLAQLPQAYRQALEAKYLEGRSVQAMAAAAGSTEDAVKSLLARAREAFRRAFRVLAETTPNPV